MLTCKLSLIVKRNPLSVHYSECLPQIETRHIHHAKHNTFRRVQELIQSVMQQVAKLEHLPKQTLHFGCPGLDTSEC
jgi:hypothetical protein